MWSRIRIRISGLIQIQMSTRSLPKCWGFIALSATVIWPKFCVNRKVTVWEMVRNVLKCPIPQQWCKNGKVIEHPHVDTAKHRKLITLGCHALPMPTMFGQRPFPHLWVILLTHRKRQTERMIALLRQPWRVIITRGRWHHSWLTQLVVCRLCQPLTATGNCYSSSSFLACNSRLRSAICRHHPPQRAVLSQICCFGERKMVMFQILLDGAEPCDAGTTQLSSPVCYWPPLMHRLIGLCINGGQ